MEQNYQKHARIDSFFHFVIAPVGIITLILGVVQFVRPLLKDDFSLASLVLLFVTILVFLISVKVRGYALKLQDRLVRSEENFRYFVLTGKRLDGNLTLKQIIALRFASDAEYPALVEKTIQEKLSPDQIKQAVKNWRADHHRV